MPIPDLARLAGGDAYHGQRRRGEGERGGAAAVADAPTPTLAPGRGTYARAVVNASIRAGRQPATVAGSYATIPNAGNNTVVLKGATPKEQARRQKLVNMLNTYDRTFAREAQNPKLNENIIHHRAISAAGLTGDGLMNARGFAGKKVSSSPGVFFPPAR